MSTYLATNNVEPCSSVPTKVGASRDGAGRHGRAFVFGGNEDSVMGERGERRLVLLVGRTVQDGDIDSQRTTATRKSSRGRRGADSRVRFDATRLLAFGRDTSEERAGPFVGVTV